MERVDMEADKKPVLYSVPEAALKLHLPPKWFYERTRINAIPHRRFGKHVRFSESDLEAIIKNAEVPPTLSGIVYNNGNGRKDKATTE
jgi:excisionase family DNA binding protein